MPRKEAVVCFSIAAFLLLAPAKACALKIDPERIEVRTGYGWQYTNATRPNNFQITPLILSTVFPLSHETGPSWLRGRFSWNPELFGAVFSHPYVRPLLGVTPLQFEYELSSKTRFHPYGIIGAGVLWANVNRRETRQDLNFNIQGGLGLRCDLSGSTALLAEYRHIHISNAGLHEDNAGMNTHTFLAGISIKR